jgi:hypothetical protein
MANNQAANQGGQVYFTACLWDILLPTMFITLIALVIFPQSRKLLFPPAPIALVDTETGGVQKTA